jgi:hypothetical protein
MVNQNISSFFFLFFLFYFISFSREQLYYCVILDSNIDVNRFFQLHSPKYAQTLIHGQQDYL